MPVDCSFSHIRIVNSRCTWSTETGQLQNIMGNGSNHLQSVGLNNND